jgi:hypothetical protein
MEQQSSKKRPITPTDSQGRNKSNKLKSARTENELTRLLSFNNNDLESNINSEAHFRHLKTMKEKIGDHAFSSPVRDMCAVDQETRKVN